MKKAVKEKILIVDDDFLNVEIIEEILGDQYDFRVAVCGDEALKIAAKFLPDLILLDIMMLDMDGYEVCRRIRDHQELSLTKIILVSAKQMLSDRLDGYKAGADDYISKPFDPEEFLAKIRVFLRLKSVEEVEKIKSDLLSVFSHETRTPLHSIVGFSTLLCENDALSENDHEALSHIMKSGQDLLELIDKTILLANLRDGTNVPSESEVQLAKVVKMAVERISGESTFHGVEFDVDLAAGIMIMADEELMVTAFTCLFDNAIKYASENSIVHVSAVNEKNSLVLLVESTGKSIPKHKIKNLFSEFMVDDVAHHGRGHGLELSIVKNIVELHEGAVSVDTDWGEKRTCFKLYFPSSRISG